MISVIIPIYNGAANMDNLYNSFKNQSYTNFELIFVNDGSTDCTLAKLKNLAQKNELNIKYFSQERRGVSAARNTGIDKASGEFICFCDVDDEVKPGYLGEMAVWMADKDIDLVFTSIMIEKNNKVILPHYTGDTFIMSHKMALERFLYDNMEISCCSMLVRRRILFTNNLRFADGYKYGEDLHMIWRLIAYSNHIAYVDKPLYIYKLHHGSAMSKFNKDRFHAYYLILKLEEFFMRKSSDFSHKFKKHAANKVLWSITWQQSTCLSISAFHRFIRKHQIKRKMWQLLTFKSKKVALSAFVCILSPSLFRLSAIWFGKKYIS